MSSRDQMTRGFAPSKPDARESCSSRSSQAMRRSQARRAGCSVHRYYDPATDQFLSVDPAVMQTGQPYAFAGNDPLNATDPTGLKGWYCLGGVTHYYSGNAYGAVGPGGCGSSPSQNCHWGDSACITDSQFATDVFLVGVC